MFWISDYRWYNVKIKYFQGVAEIMRHYEDILFHFSNEKYGHLLLETWDVYPEDINEIREEYDFLRYLLGVQLGLVRETGVEKPSVEVVNRCLNRHLAFIKKIHKCDERTYKEHRSPFIKNEYKACKHYLFQFSLNGWYKRLPDKIISFEEKYQKK